MPCLEAPGLFGVSLMHTCIIDNNCISLFHIHIVITDALRSELPDTAEVKASSVDFFQFFYFFKDIGKI